jgi:Conserved TM helix
MDQQAMSWSGSLMASLSSAMTMLFAAVPRILGFLIILAIGWLLASLIEKALVAILRAVRFDAVVERAGLGGMVQAVKHEPSAVFGAIAKWFVWLIALVVAFDALGVPAVSQVLHQLLMWLPNLAVALLVLVVGGFAANALGDLVRGAAAKARVERPDLPGKIAKWSVWGFAGLVALYQIGVAGALLDILFMAVVGAVALAVGLSFGLGARDTAGMIVRDFYERNRGGSSPVVGRGMGAANEPPLSRPMYSGVEHRRALADRRSSPNGRRAGP